MRSSNIKSICHGLLPCPRCAISANVPTERSGGCKFTQFVTYHVFGNVDRDMSPTIVHRDGMTYHLREDSACATPGSNDLFVSALIHILHTLEQLRLYVGAFF